MQAWINYHHLFYFKTIVEQGSVSKAANHLRLGQPTLSAQLKQLEAAMGVTLFERQHKKLVLTESGRMAYDYVKVIFQTGAEMYEVLHDRRRPQKVSLQIGAIDSIPKHVVVKLIEHAFQVADCQITQIEGRPDELIRELTAHKIDLILTDLLPAGIDAKGIMHRSLSVKNLAFYGNASFKKIKKSFPQSMKDIPVIVPTHDSRLRYDIEHWARTKNISLNIAVETQDISVKKLMAINGMGVIAAASHTVVQQVRAGDLFQIGELQGVHEELYLLSAKRKIPNPLAARLFNSFQL